MTESPASGNVEVEMGLEPPESERLTKLTGENAKLRAEVRQALARAQRSEADAARVRASTKFQVGDLLVKAARHPRRALLLPRDLLRLYRLRRHRRTQPASEDTTTAPARMRRSDYTDEIAARLLLPRIAEQPHRPLAVAGALDPIRSMFWGSCAAVTQVLPHDAATLTAEVDPDIVMIDALATGPLGAWSHLGNPAATDRALAAEALLDAAKSHGRPVVLLRATAADAGLDSIAERCDLVLDGPGAPRRNPWQPGIDLAIVSRCAPGLLADTTTRERTDAVSPPSVLALPLHEHPGSDLLDADSMDDDILDAWSQAAHDRGASVVTLPEGTPPASAFISAIGHAQVIALNGRTSPTLTGAPLAALAALACGLPLVSPADPDLADILGTRSPEDSWPWFTYQPESTASARAALAAALDCGPVDRRQVWHAWRALFASATPPVTWSRAITALGLSARPTSVRDVAVRLTDQPGDTMTDPTPLIESLALQSHRPIEIIAVGERARAVRGALDARGIDDITVITIDRDDAGSWARTAQSSTAALIIGLPDSEDGSLPAQLLQDAVIAHEMCGDAPVTRLMPVGWPDAVTVLSRTAALSLSTPLDNSVYVHHPGWSA